DRRQAFEEMVMLSHAWDLGQNILLALLPFFLLLVLVALVAPVLLGGWLFSSKSLAPQFSRLNPLKGLGRLFSSNALAELGKVLAKSALLLSIAAWYLISRGDELLSLKSEAIEPALIHSLRLTGSAAALMVLAL